MPWVRAGADAATGLDTEARQGSGAGLAPLATKADLKNTETSLTADLRATEARLKADMLVLKADMIAHTDKKVGEIQRMQRWMLGTLVVIALSLVGGLFAVVASLLGS